MPSPHLSARFLRELPPDPPFPGSCLCLARLSDLARIFVLAAAGLFYKPTFHCERPCHNRYPLNTLSDSKELFRSSILDPKKVVIVAKGEYRKTEINGTYDALSIVCPSLEE